eukprot:5468135-Prymnesium_polylepis.1
MWCMLPSNRPHQRTCCPGLSTVLPPSGASGRASSRRAVEPGVSELVRVQRVHLVVAHKPLDDALALHAQGAQLRPLDPRQPGSCAGGDRSRRTLALLLIKEGLDDAPRQLPARRAIRRAHRTCRRRPEYTLSDQAMRESLRLLPAHCGARWTRELHLREVEAVSGRHLRHRQQQRPLFALLLRRIAAQ